MKFIPYFNEHISPVKIIPKSSSSFMKALGGFLSLGEKLGLTNIDKQSFMSDYTTTIGDTIYSNDLTINSNPSSLLLHELTHVLQFKVRGMSTQYLLSPKKRAYYESEAVQTTLLCFPEIKVTQGFIDRKVAWLKDYGCKESVARKEITDRIAEIKSGHPQPRARAIYRALMNWRASQAIRTSTR